VDKQVKAEEVKQKCAKLIGYDTCFICEAKKSRRGFTIHHLEYIFNDVIYKHYPKTADGKLKYYEDLLVMVEANPARFMYLCNTDHIALERINRYSPKKLIKLIEALLLTHTNKNNSHELRKLLRSMINK
jgi:hypothetical protein